MKKEIAVEWREELEQIRQYLKTLLPENYGN